MTTYEMIPECCYPSDYERQNTLGESDRPFIERKYGSGVWYGHDKRGRRLVADYHVGFCKSHMPGVTYARDINSYRRGMVMTICTNCGKYLGSRPAGTPGWPTPKGSSNDSSNNNKS